MEKSPDSVNALLGPLSERLRPTNGGHLALVCSTMEREAVVRLLAEDAKKKVPSNTRWNVLALPRLSPSPQNRFSTRAAAMCVCALCVVCVNV